MDRLATSPSPSTSHVHVHVNVNVNVNVHVNVNVNVHEAGLARGEVQMRRAPSLSEERPRRQQALSTGYFFSAASFSLYAFIIASCSFLGTAAYLANSMVNSPLPWVAERRSVE